MSSQEEMQTELLREILKWIKFAGVKEVKEVLVSELESDQKKQVYKMSDGSKTNSEINKVTGVSAGAISGYWKKWVKKGLGDKISVQGGERFAGAFDLEDFGISVPESKTQSVKEKVKKEPSEKKGKSQNGN